MALTKYSELKTGLANWIHRGESDVPIEDFLTLAAIRIVHDLESPHLKKLLSDTMSSEYYDLPSDLIAIENVRINDKIIKFFSMTQISELGYDGATGEEAVYTIEANKLRVIGAPSAASLKIVYKYKPAAMSGDDDADVILQNYPNLYIYAGRLEYVAFAEDDLPEAEKWAKLYADAIEQINHSAERTQYPDGSLEVRAV